MESVRSLDASSLPLNRDQFLDLASSLNEFFLQNGLIKSELPNAGCTDVTTQLQEQLLQLQQQPQMMPSAGLLPAPANYHHQHHHQDLSPQQIYHCQNYPPPPVNDDQTPSPRM